MLQVIEHDVFDVSRRSHSTARRQRFLFPLPHVSQGRELRSLPSARPHACGQMRRLPPPQPNIQRDLLYPRRRAHPAEGAQSLDQGVLKSRSVVKCQSDRRKPIEPIEPESSSPGSDEADCLDKALVGTRLPIRYTRWWRHPQRLNGGTDSVLICPDIIELHPSGLRHKV